MSHVDRDDMVVVGMSIDALLECVRQTETWWRARGDRVGLQRTRQLGHAILMTRRKFFAEESRSKDVQIAEAHIVAEGLRDAARQCNEGQAALHARLMIGAATIEQLCRLHEARRDGDDWSA
jgi:hypothetical protein